MNQPPPIPIRPKNLMCPSEKTRFYEERRTLESLRYLHSKYVREANLIEAAFYAYCNKPPEIEAELRPVDVTHIGETILFDLSEKIHDFRATFQQPPSGINRQWGAYRALEPQVKLGGRKKKSTRQSTRKSTRKAKN